MFEAVSDRDHDPCSDVNHIKTFCLSPGRDWLNLEFQTVEELKKKKYTIEHFVEDSEIQRIEGRCKKIFRSYQEKMWDDCTSVLTITTQSNVSVLNENIKDRRVQSQVEKSNRYLYRYNFLECLKEMQPDKLLFLILHQCNHWFCKIILSFKEQNKCNDGTNAMQGDKLVSFACQVKWYKYDTSKNSDPARRANFIILIY